MREREERAAVAAVVDAYIESGRRGSVTLARQVFQENAAIHGYLDGALLTGPIQHLYDWIEKHGAAPEIESLTLSIDVEGRIANAKVQSRDWCGYDFTDLLHLIRTEAGWKIVNKMFHHA